MNILALNSQYKFMKNKFKSQLSVFIIVICVLIVAVTYLIIENRLSLYPSPQKHILVGTNISIPALENGSNCSYLTFDGTYLSGDKYAQNIKLTIPDNINNSVLRVSSFVTNVDGTREKILIETASSWVYEEGYYYYQKKIQGGEILNLSKYIIIPDGKYDNQTFYNIAVLVEMYEYNEKTLDTVLLNTPQVIKNIWAS